MNQIAFVLRISQPLSEALGDLGNPKEKNDTPHIISLG
jgi:hypothetical protein